MPRGAIRKGSERQRRRFGKLLREQRMSKRISVEELADKVGVTMSCIYLWETGRSVPRRDNLNAACKALKLPIRQMEQVIGAG